MLIPNVVARIQEVKEDFQKQKYQIQDMSRSVRTATDLEPLLKQVQAEVNEHRAKIGYFQAAWSETLFKQITETNETVKQMSYEFQTVHTLVSNIVLKSEFAEVIQKFEKTVPLDRFEDLERLVSGDTFIERQQFDIMSDNYTNLSKKVEKMYSREELVN